jgi:hypothetical protein
MKALATVLTILVSLLHGAPGAAAEVEYPKLFLELAKNYRPEDGGRLTSVRSRLTREIPGLLGRPLPPCPLRSALAKALPRARARDLLANRDADLLAVVVCNLAARPDLATLILETGADARLLKTHASLLAAVGANALLDGDSRLVHRLLAGPGQNAAAGMLSRLPHPGGLRYLADVVAGKVTIPPEARARLALFEPDVQNSRPTRPLDAPRVMALNRIAASDPDHAMRALAARVLLRANDPKFAPETIRAFVEANSVHLGDIDWHHLAKLAAAPVSDPRVSIAHRIDLLESWLLCKWIRAETEPVTAEAQAAILRPVLASARPRFRGEVIAYLETFHYVFVTTTFGRKRPVPSLMGILADLETGRPGDPPALTAFGTAAARRIRAEIAAEEGYPEVRVRDAHIGEERAWRPGDEKRERVVQSLLDQRMTPARYREALAIVADASLPPDSRHRLFEALAWVAEAGPVEWPGEPECGDDEDDPPLDTRYFEILIAWVRDRAPELDGGLPEAILGHAMDGSGPFPEGREDEGWKAFDEAVERMPPGGSRIRLEALRKSGLAYR